jgi:hypothetical protein
VSALENVGLQHDEPAVMMMMMGGSPKVIDSPITTRRDRQQAPDHADEIRGRHQPVTLSEAGKLCLRAVQRWGSDHSM